jgi:hypothetical protein
MFGELQRTASALRWAAGKPPLSTQIARPAYWRTAARLSDSRTSQPSRMSGAPGVRPALTT